MKNFLFLLFFTIPNLVLGQAGEIDITFTPTDFSSSIFSIVFIQPDDKILLIGNSGIKRLLKDGNLDPEFDIGSANYPDSRAIHLQKDGKVLVGGFFTQFRGAPKSYLIRLLPDGTPDLSFDTGKGPNGAVFRILTQPDDKILIIGCFTEIDGIFRNRIARLNPDGSLDNSFDIGKDTLIVLEPCNPDDEGTGIYSLALQEDGKIIFGGSFSSRYYGSPEVPNSIERVNPDGSRDLSFNRGEGFGHVGIEFGPWDIAIQKDGKILCAGSFFKYQNQPRNGIVRINPDGTLDSSFDPGIGMEDAWLANLLVQDDGKIAIAGIFSLFNGEEIQSLVRLNSDGSIDRSFKTYSSGIFARSIGRQSNGKYIIGGIANFENYQSRGIVRLLSDQENIEPCLIEIKIRQELEIKLDFFGKARLTPEMLDLGTCGDCGPYKIELSKCNFTCGDLGEQIIDVQVFDKFGNMESTTTKLTVVDKVYPTVNLYEGTFSWIINSGDSFVLPDFRNLIGASDNCSFEIRQSPKPGTIYKKAQTSTINFEVEDCSGNITCVSIGFSLLILKSKDWNSSIRILNESESNVISVPWNTSLDEIISKSIEFEEGSNPEIVKQIEWDPLDFQPLIPGEYSIEAKLKNDIFNGMNSSLEILLQIGKKQSPEDIIINRNIISRNVRKEEIIGKLITIDQMDNIHFYSMEEHPDLYIEKDVLVWKGSGMPELIVSAKVFSMDRAGQIISKEIILERESPKLSDFLVYPNPTKSILNIEFRLNEPSEVDLIIFNSFGIIVFEDKSLQERNYYRRIDLENLSSGLYIIQVQSGGESITKKILKE